jgi:hypothetical protein
MVVAVEVGAEKGVRWGRKEVRGEASGTRPPEPCEPYTKSTESALGDGEGTNAMSDGDGGCRCVDDDEVAVEGDDDGEGDDGDNNNGEEDEWVATSCFMSSTFSRRGRETEARWTWSNRRS